MNITALSKKIIGSLLTVAVGLAPSTALAATLSLSPASGTFNRNCNFNLAITLDTQGAQTDGVDAILFYDPSRFSASKINNGTIYAEYPGSNIDAQAGKIIISGLASTTAPFTGTGTLATVEFKVLEAAPTGVTQVRFDFDPNDKSKTSDSNVAERNTVTDILSAVTDGNYTVGTGTCGTTGSGLSPAPKGGTGETIPTKTLPEAGFADTTVVLTVIGGVLTVLGIIGLALL